MNARAIIVALLVCCGCGGAPPVIDEPVATANVLRFTAGARHRYRFAWKVEAQTRAAAFFEQVDVNGGIELAGELDVRVYGRDERGWVLGCRFGRLDCTSLTAFGHEALDRPEAVAQLDGHEALLVVDPAGEAAPRVHFDRDSSAVFRHLMAGLLVHVDLVVPQDTGGWRALVPAANGLARARYEVDAHDARRLHRSFDDYERFDALVGGPLQAGREVEGEGWITLDRDGVPTHIEAQEHVMLAAASLEEPGFDSRTTVSFVRESVEPMAPTVIPPTGGKLVRDLGAPPDYAESERELAGRFAEDLTIADLQLELEGVAHGLRAPRGLMTRATGLLRSQPTLAARVGELAADLEEPRARAYALDVLSSAGTPEAQAELCDALARLERLGDDELPWLLQRLALLERPSPASVAFAAELFERASARGDLRLRNAGAYVLGSMAGAIADDDPATAAVLRARLVELLTSTDEDDARVAALAGIGNAGAPEDLELVLAHVDATSDAVRLQAASSLRFHDDPLARAALRDLARDRTAPVAMLALSTLDMYALPDEDLLELARMVTDEEIADDVGSTLVNVLSRHVERSPALHGALYTMWTREKQLHRRLRLGRLLGTEA